METIMLSRTDYLHTLDAVTAFWTNRQSECLPDSTWAIDYALGFARWASKDTGACGCQADEFGHPVRRFCTLHS